MKNKITIFFAVALLCSCAKESADSTADDRVEYTPAVTLAAETKTIIDGTQYFPFMSFGAWVESAVPANTQWYHDMGYDNISATRSTSAYNSAWTYLPKGGTITYNNIIGLFKSRGAVDVYGIAPRSSTFSPTIADAVPFTIGTTGSTMYDYMYTGPVTVDPNVPADLSKALAFKHFMTLLDFRLSTTLRGVLKVRKMIINAKDGGGNPRNIFYTTGTFNARTGAVSPSTPVNAMTIEYDREVQYRSRSLGYTSFELIVPQIAHQADTHITVMFDFEWEGSDDAGDGELTNIKGSTIQFTLDDIKTPAGGTNQGFLANYRYAFVINVDNFIKYNGYPIVMPWTDDVDQDDNLIVNELIF